MAEFNAVLSGGGVKGIGLVGALKRVEQEGVNITRIAGSSAGAIVASLYASGYSCEEMTDILMETDFNCLLDSVYFQYYQIWKHCGIYKGDKFLNWLSDLLSKKNVSTFSSLDKLGKELFLIASDITNKSIEVFNKEEYPKLDIATAVRMSIGIPFMFRPYKFGENYYVDGGVLSNFPIWIFQSSEIPTIGFKLVSDTNLQQVNHPEKIMNYLGLLISTMLDAHDNMAENEGEENQIIHISTGNIATTNFELNKNQKEDLFNRGYVAASKFIEAHSLQQMSAECIPTNEIDKEEKTIRVQLYETLQRARFSKNYKREKNLHINTVVKEINIYYPEAYAEWNQVEGGVNMSDINIESVARTVLSETPTEFQLLSCKGWHQFDDEQRKSSISSESSKDERRHNIIMGFGGRVLKPKKLIRFGFSLTWPGAKARKEDYAIFSCHHYDVAVERLTIRIGFKSFPKNIALYSCTEESQKPVDIFESSIAKDSRGEDLFYYETTIENPKNIYLAKWKL